MAKLKKRNGSCIVEIEEQENDYHNIWADSDNLENWFMTNISTGLKTPIIRRKEIIKVLKKEQIKAP
jgi:hypothetical protein